MNNMQKVAFLDGYHAGLKLHKKANLFDGVSPLPSEMSYGKGQLESVGKGLGRFAGQSDASLQKNLPMSYKNPAAVMAKIQTLGTNPDNPPAPAPAPAPKKRAATTDFTPSLTPRKGKKGFGA